MNIRVRERKKNPVSAQLLQEWGVYFEHHQQEVDSEYRLALMYRDLFRRRGVEKMKWPRSLSEIGNDLHSMKSTLELF